MIMTGDELKREVEKGLEEIRPFLQRDAFYTINGNEIVLSDQDGVTLTIEDYSENGFNLLGKQLEIDGDDSYEVNFTFELKRQ